MSKLNMTPLESQREIWSCILWNAFCNFTLESIRISKQWNTNKIWNM